MVIIVAVIIYLEYDNINVIPNYSSSIGYPLSGLYYSIYITLATRYILITCLSIILIELSFRYTRGCGSGRPSAKTLVTGPRPRFPYSNSLRT